MKFSTKVERSIIKWWGVITKFKYRYIFDKGYRTAYMLMVNNPKFKTHMLWIQKKYLLFLNAPHSKEVENDTWIMFLIKAFNVGHKDNLSVYIDSRNKSNLAANAYLNVFDYMVLNDKYE